MLLFLVLLLAWFLLRKTEYGRALLVILFALFVVNSIYIARMYIPRNIEKYKEGSIKAGDIVGTFKTITPNPIYVLFRQFILLCGGYHSFHVGVVVEHQNKLYLLHGNPTGALIKSREGISRVEKIKTLRTFKSWDICLEPLESFLSAEKKEGSILSIIPTNRHLVYNDSSVQAITIDDSILTNCSCLLGKYLEKEGLCENNTFIHDSAHYTPNYFSNRFGNLRELRL